MALARREPKVGLALGSGSARGWAHFGVLHALRCAAAQVDADGRMRLRRGGGSDGDAEALIGDLMRRRSLTPPETAPPPPGTAP